MAAEFGGTPELDLHDVRDLSSGIYELDYFLNAQFMRRQRAVKIIHGRGTGAMRNAVHADRKSVV